MTSCRRCAPKDIRSPCRLDVSHAVGQPRLIFAVLYPVAATSVTVRSAAQGRPAEALRFQ
jgi:hypothetical protein